MITIIIGKHIFLVKTWIDSGSIFHPCDGEWVRYGRRFASELCRLSSACGHVSRGWDYGRTSESEMKPTLQGTITSGHGHAEISALRVFGSLHRHLWSVSDDLTKKSPVKLGDGKRDFEGPDTGGDGRVIGPRIKAAYLQVLLHLCVYFGPPNYRYCTLFRETYQVAFHMVPGNFRVRIGVHFTSESHFSPFFCRFAPRGGLKPRRIWRKIRDISWIVGESRREERKREWKVIWTRQNENMTR